MEGNAGGAGVPCNHVWSNRVSIIQQDWLDAHKVELDSVPVRKRDHSHPYACGTGPAGQTCGTCSKLCRVHYHDKTYRKCHVLMKHWSHGGATDIRRKDPACKSWEPRVEKVELATTRHRSPHVNY